MKITVNTKTSGKYRKEFLNDREHIVTDMVPIVGNSVMNRGFYPLEEVQKSFDQLHHLPAPNGHPKVGNQLVSAFHPIATNAFNIGGFVRNPKMDGDKVVNEFWLDIDIANKSDDGKELIRRIENAEEVEVSTGLTVRQEIVNEQNNDYDWIARDLNFDHVAILLNEKAAGSHVGTKLQLNSKDNSLMVVNCAIIAEDDSQKEDRMSVLAEDKMVNKIINKMKQTFVFRENALSSNDILSRLTDALREVYGSEYYVYPLTFFPEEKRVVYELEQKQEPHSTLLKQRTYSIDESENVSLNDDSVEVVKKEEFVPVSGDASETDNQTLEEGDEMAKQSPNQSESVTNSDAKALNVENAINLLEAKGFKVNTEEEAKELEYFVQNRSRFEEIINREEAELQSLRDKIVANSELEEDDVKSMSPSMLKRMANSVIKPQDYSLQGGTTREVANSESVDFEESYSSIDYSNGGQ